MRFTRRRQEQRYTTLAEPVRSPRSVSGERAAAFVATSTARGEVILKTEERCSGGFEVHFNDGILMRVRRIETFDVHAEIVPKKPRA